MSKKSVYLTILVIVLMGVLGASFNVHKVEAQVGTIYIRADGSIDPPTANITSPDNVTYIFTADINASIVVQKDNIVIDGAGYTVQGGGGGTGIDLSSRSNVTIKNMRIKEFFYGIYLYSSSNNTISGNEISANSNGIDLSASTRNVLSGNNVTSNVYAGIKLVGDFVNASIVGSNNNTISGNNIVENYNGIEASGANFTNIFGNNLTSNSLYGITFDNAGYNTVIMNSITNNGLGILIEGPESMGSVLHHNNIIDNAIQVELQIDYSLAWDNGFEGNYWSDLDGVDSNHDGISDTELAIGLDSINVDHFPLMGSFHSFSTSAGEYVNVVSNSTVTYFDYEESKGWITIQVRNATAEQTSGFCRVCIPHNLMDPEVTWISFFIDDGTVAPLYFNNTLYDNGTHRWIYIAYPHPYSMHEIVITPEFPSLIILPLFIITTLLAIIVYRRKHSK